MDDFLRLCPIDIRFFMIGLIGEILPLTPGSESRIRRDAMLRVFSPIGFDLIFAPNSRF